MIRTRFLTNKKSVAIHEDLNQKKKKRKTENLAGVHSFSSNDDRTALISTPLSYLMKLWVQLKKLWRNILSPWLKKKVTDHKGYPFFLILMKLASTGSKCSQVCTLSQGLRLQGSTDCSWRFNWYYFYYNCWLYWCSTYWHWFWIVPPILFFFISLVIFHVQFWRTCSFSGIHISQ